MGKAEDWNWERRGLDREEGGTGVGKRVGVARRMSRGLITCKEDDRWQHSRCDVDRGCCVQVCLQHPVRGPHILLSIFYLPSHCSLNDGTGHLHTKGKGLQGVGF